MSTLDHHVFEDHNTNAVVILNDRSAAKGVESQP
jgi:hypothetical protein